MEAMMVAMDSAQSKLDRARELRAFDDTKAGVKGLVDAVVENVPQIFVLPHDDNMTKNGTGDTAKANFTVPVIDLQGVDQNDSTLHQEIVDRIRHASETWGFFQVVNHGIPVGVLEEMLRGVRRFNETRRGGEEAILHA
ncbi:UNVERIFIED_CONTAM: 1-aminocyclopropane-1-carboxylate oxidase [Sesamum latifolium]|uniref:1-aminocyclopropane-1-carboxylate oxidase n=1 Tax=Sesamum latifolium TaxID=2727402 RepID=A0AAW2XTS9_9LAMI